MVPVRISVPVCTLLVLAAAAGEFRGFQPIAKPGKLPAGAKRVAAVEPVGHRVAEALVRKFLTSWNTPDFGKGLGPGFYDKSRLLDAIDSKVPRDATLRIMSIQHIQTVAQYRKPHGDSLLIVSRISATVTTQIEYNTAGDGFQKREGVNEFIFEVIQTKPRKTE